jgi:hypothetical protein
VPVHGCTLPYSRAIPLHLLLAVRPVQSLSACTRVHFTFYPPYWKLAMSHSLLRHFGNERTSFTLPEKQTPIPRSSTCSLVTGLVRLPHNEEALLPATCNDQKTLAAAHHDSCPSCVGKAPSIFINHTFHAGVNKNPPAPAALHPQEET